MRSDLDLVILWVVGMVLIIFGFPPLFDWLAANIQIGAP